MSEVTTVTQVAQIGVETTEGTAVAASKYLPSIGIELDPDLTINPFRPTGNKFTTIHQIGKDYCVAPITGQPTYDEMNYLFNSLLQKVNGVQQSATTAYKRTYGPSSTDEDTVDTFTVETGSSVRARKAAGLRVVSLGMKGSRNGIELSGQAIGRAISTGITMTSSPTAIPQVPILPKHVDIYVDSASGSLGTTKLTRSFEWEWMLGNRAAPFWPVNSALPSYGGFAEGANDATLKLKLEGDSTGDGYLADARAGTTRFVRIKATSDVLAGTAIYYSLQMDFAVQVKSVGKPGDHENIWCTDYEFDIVHDATWGKALAFELISKTNAL